MCFYIYFLSQSYLFCRMCLFVSFILYCLLTNATAMFHKNSEDTIMWVARQSEMLVSDNCSISQEFQRCDHVSCPPLCWKCGCQTAGCGKIRKQFDAVTSLVRDHAETTTLMKDHLDERLFLLNLLCHISMSVKHWPWTLHTHPPTHTPCQAVYAWLSLWCHQRCSHHRVYAGELWPFSVYSTGCVCQYVPLLRAIGQTYIMQRSAPTASLLT